MCCPLDQAQGKFIPQAVAFEEIGEEKVVYVGGYRPHSIDLSRSNHSFFSTP